MPIHFLSAGVAGAAVGIGWAQGFLASDEDAAQQRKVVALGFGSRLPALILGLAEARRRQAQQQQKHDQDEQ
jgi:hypothetical protein